MATSCPGCSWSPPRMELGRRGKGIPARMKVQSQVSSLMARVKTSRVGEQVPDLRPETWDLRLFLRRRNGLPVRSGDHLVVDSAGPDQDSHELRRQDPRQLVQGLRTGDGDRAFDAGLAERG